MVGLPIQHIGEVRRQASLCESHVEEVREPVAQETMVRPHPLRPVLGEGDTVATVDFTLRARV